MKVKREKKEKQKTQKSLQIELPNLKLFRLVVAYWKYIPKGINVHQKQILKVFKRKKWQHFKMVQNRTT